VEVVSSVVNIVLTVIVKYKSSVILLFGDIIYKLILKLVHNVQLINVKPVKPPILVLTVGMDIVFGLIVKMLPIRIIINVLNVPPTVKNVKMINLDLIEEFAQFVMTNTTS
jgi:hypothetical protein